MNLFVVKWGPKALTAADLHASLARDAMHAQLADGCQSDSWDSPCSGAAFACIHEGQARAAPREYLHHDDDDIVTYDGLPIAVAAGFAAHRAADLARRWDQVDADVDGLYGAIRLSKNPLRLEVQTDLLGVYKVYYWTDGQSWLVSNSTAAIDHLIEGLSFNSTAAGLLFSLAWVPGDYTLVDGIRCVGAGMRMTWNMGQPQPTTRPTIRLRELFRDPPQKPTDALVGELHAQLLHECQSIGADFANVFCPLTGGKDSRLLAALLHEADVDARSYTYGNAIGSDAQIAGRVADELGVNHENIITRTDQLFSDWSNVSAEFVRRGAGMCPLQLITGIVTAELVDMPNKPVRYWGAGSSVCRAPFFNSTDYVRKTNLQTIKRRLTRMLVKDYRGLVRQDAVDAAKDYIATELDRYEADGVRPIDLPDVFWIYERGASRSGKNMRVTMNHRDTVSPFFGRAFVTASFRLSALQRATEPLHFRLMKRSAPAIFGIPFDKGAWKAQNATLNLLTELRKLVNFRVRHLIAKRVLRRKPGGAKHMLVRDTMFERGQWLRLLTGNLREMALDTSNADLWDLVDRERFMKLTADDVSDAELSFNVVPLFSIGTALMYRRERDSGR